MFSVLSMIQIISHRVSISKIFPVPLKFSHPIVMTTLLMQSPLSLVQTIVRLIFRRAVQFLIIFLLMKRLSLVSLAMFLLVAPHALQMSPHPKVCVPPGSLLLLVVRVMQKSVLMFCYLMLLFLCAHPIIIVLVDFLQLYCIVCTQKTDLFSSVTVCFSSMKSVIVVLSLGFIDSDRRFLKRRRKVGI